MAAKKQDKSDGKTRVVIAAPNFQTAEFTIEGTAPYVQNKFSAKARDGLHGKHVAGSQGKKGAKRESKDFKACYEDAKHRCGDWLGIPAAGLRSAMVSACRVAGFAMTVAKLSVFVEADGFDDEDGTPLVRITKGEPRYHEAAVRNSGKVTDLRARPMWREGWRAKVRVKFDGDQFSLVDTSNLLARVGEQVGIGEGRPDSKSSTGMGWGTFRVLDE